MGNVGYYGRNADAICGRPGTPEPYGQRYIIDFDPVRQCGTVRIRTAVGRKGLVASVWVGGVALLEDLPEEGLVRGQVGAVVEKWGPGVYEVEFCDENGRSYAMVALKAEQLLRLHHALRTKLPERVY